MNKENKKEQLKKQIEQLIPELVDVEDHPDVLDEKKLYRERLSRRRKRYLWTILGSVLVCFYLIRVDSEVAGKARVAPYKLTLVEAQEIGILKELYFKEGDMVKKGDLIGKIYNPDYYTELEQARNEVAIINNTQKQLQQRMAWLKTLIGRNETLYKEEVIALAEMETTQLDYDFTQLEHEKNVKRLETLDVRIKYLEERVASTEVIAPTTGLITQRLEEKKGTYVEKGDPICEIVDLSRIVLEFPVYEEKIRNIRPGQNVEIRFLAFPKTAVMGKVTSLYPTAWEKVEKVWVKKNVINVRIEAEQVSSDLKVGMTAQVRVFTGKQPLLFVLLNKVSFD